MEVQKKVISLGANNFLLQFPVRLSLVELSSISFEGRQSCPHFLGPDGFCSH